VVMVVLPDPFRKMEARRYSVDTQKSGNIPKSGTRGKKRPLSFIESAAIHLVDSANHLVNCHRPDV